MKTITFTHTFTFPEPAVIGFAKFLGYRETIQTTTENGYEEVPNTETPVEYVTRLSKEHSLQFTAQWAKYLADEELAKQISVIKPQIDAVILKPVEDALQVTAKVND